MTRTCLQANPGSVISTVGRAWEAAKEEITLLAISASAGGCFAAASAVQASEGRVLPATLSGAAAGVWGLLSAYRVYRIAHTLKEQPKP